MTDSGSSAEIVVIIAAAQDEDSLTRIVSALPARFPVPVVVALDSGAPQTAHVSELLAAATELSVRRVSVEQQLGAGGVYVVSGNVPVSVRDGRLQTNERASGAEKLVDALLSSAAAECGEGLTAVLLAGAAAAWFDAVYDVRRVGGTLIMEAPVARRHSSADGTDATPAGVVGGAERIGEVLVSLFGGSGEVGCGREERALHMLLEQLRERAGIDFNQYKLPTIIRRLQRRMAATNSSTLQSYRVYLESHPTEYERLVSSFLIKVTEFFRDPEIFSHLRRQVIPRVAEEARRRDNQIRLWSAGCATGEEAYSLAIILAEALGGELDDFGIRIFATDLDEEALAFARQGIYPASALSGLPKRLITRYFDQVDGLYEVKKRIRSMLVFGHHNLAERAPFPRIDLLVCRNVLIYFTPELQRRVLALFSFSVRTGGYLVLGKAESPHPLPEYFEAEDADLKVYRRVGESMLILPVQPQEPPSSTRHHPSRTAMLTREAGRAARSEPPRTVRERAERLLQHMPIGLVLVNRRYDIQVINIAARRMLGIHGAAVGDDLIHLAQGVVATELRRVIDDMVRDKVETTGWIEAGNPADGAARFLRVSCVPEAANDEQYAMLVLEDVTDAASHRQ